MIEINDIELKRPKLKKIEEEDYSWIKWTPKRGEIYFCDLGWNLDCEQSGIRPVLVIQNNTGNEHSSTIVVIPLSTKCKCLKKIHVLIPKELGLNKDSYVLTEQIRVISKRRFFYNNNVPWRVTVLSQEKMLEVQYALEFELGLQPLMFNENEAFKMIKYIKSLKQNIKVKRSKDLVEIFNEKVREFINYCRKYNKDHVQVIEKYNRNNNFAYM